MRRASPKPDPAAEPSLAMSGKPSGVRVRMYDVGFGDCFLLFIPIHGIECKVLIDCGSIKTHTKDIKEVVGQIIQDVTDADGKARIDVVIATHRHRDHISGFADRRWSDVEVKEVWMPWTERPDDPVAQRIRQAQTRLATALHAAFLREPQYQNLVDLALNASPNDDAMDTLHYGFDGTPVRRFLPERQQSDRILRTNALPGVLVHVLGPSYDEDVIQDMDPPADQSYLQLLDDDTDRDNLPEPFGADWVDDNPRIRLSLDDEELVQGAGQGREEALAAQLDKAVNGTSLMLLFQIKGAHLLFPGDAQWGSWKAALADPDVQRLFDKLTFYKVGHHGSHNATPVDFVEKYLRKRHDQNDGIRAMVSVMSYKKWPNIPREQLIDRLRAYIGMIARSDSREIPEAFTRKPDTWIETEISI